MKKNKQTQPERKTLFVFRAAKKAAGAASDPTMTSVSVTRTTGSTPRII